MGAQRSITGPHPGPHPAWRKGKATGPDLRSVRVSTATRDTNPLYRGLENEEHTAARGRAGSHKLVAL